MPALPRRRRGPLLLAAALVAALAGCTGGEASGGPLPAQLRVALEPNPAPANQRARFARLEEHLEDALGVEVQLVVAATPDEVVAALAAGRVDVAHLDPLTFVQAASGAGGVTPLVTAVDPDSGTPRPPAAVVVAQQAAPQTVEEVVAGGGTVALGGPGSASGWLYPRLLLERAGARCTSLERCEPATTVRTTGSSEATALEVAAGRADAGGLDLGVLRRLERSGSLDRGTLRVVGTVEVMGAPWVGRTALGPGALGRVRQAFLDLEDSALLDLLRAREHVAVTPADYDEVRREAERLGLLGTAGS